MLALVRRAPCSVVILRSASAVAALAALTTLTGCGKPDLGRAEGVRLAARADGGGELTVEGWPRFALTPEDVGGRSTIELERDNALDVVSFRTVDGKWVNVVGLGGSVHRGPTTQAPAAYDVAVGALLATEKHPDAVVGAVRASKGTTAVARVLARGAATEGSTWERRLPTLSREDLEELEKAFAPLLSDASASPALLSRAVRFADPTKLTKEELVARVSGSTSAASATAPAGGLGVAVLLRVLATKGPEDAGRLGCAELGAHRYTLREPDPERQARLDAALLAIARAGVSCDKVDALVREEPCASGLRCGASGPLLANQATEQDEPVCAEAALSRAVTEELARAPAEVVKDPHPGRTSLFAFAAHTLGKRPPLADVNKQQARRLYTITQPRGPACDAIIEVGKPCRAPEAVLRDLACRNEGADVSVGTLRFRVDDDKKTISAVETAPPP